MIVKQIKSYSAPERVVKQFLKNLETGEMKPGQKLPTQDQLADLFGRRRAAELFAPLFQDTANVAIWVFHH